MNAPVLTSSVSYVRSIYSGVHCKRTQGNVVFLYVVGENDGHPVWRREFDDGAPGDNPLSGTRESNCGIAPRRWAPGQAWHSRALSGLETHGPFLKVVRFWFWGPGDFVENVVMVHTLAPPTAGKHRKMRGHHTRHNLVRSQGCAGRWSSESETKMLWLF
jgi:hypothetical protein